MRAVCGEDGERDRVDFFGLLAGSRVRRGALDVRNDRDGSDAADVGVESLERFGHRFHWSMHVVWMPPSASDQWTSVPAL